MLDIFDIIWLPVLVPVFWALGIRIARNLKLSTRLASALYWWHTLFSLLYYLLSLVKIADTRAYFAAGQSPDWVFAVGTEFVNFLAGILVSVMGMGALSTFIVFGFLGYIAMLLFAHLLIVYLPEEYGVDLDERVLYVVLFLPSLSYWGSALGKDPLAFFACCLALFAAVDLSGRRMLMLLAVLVMYMVRPHAAICMLIALAAAMLCSSDVSRTSRTSVSLMVGLAVLLLWPFVNQYVGFDQAGGDIGEYIAWRQGIRYKDAVAEVSLTEMSLPMRLFTYMFRPLFIDASGALMLLGSFENVLLLILFIRYFRKFFQIVVWGSQLFFRYAVFYSLLMWVMLGNVTTNLGAAYRQKTMILPALLVLLVFSTAKISDSEELSIYSGNVD